MSRWAITFKIFGLLIVLAIVISTMRSMTPEKVNSAFNALGVEPAAPGQAGLQAGGRPLEKGEVRRTLCRTRLQAVRFPDGRAVVEEKQGMKLNWMALEPSKDPRSIGYLEIEKWLSQHCQFNALPLAAGPQDHRGEKSADASARDWAIFEFIDQTKWTLKHQEGFIFSVENPEDRFISRDLEEALAELRKIAGF